MIDSTGRLGKKRKCCAVAVAIAAAPLLVFVGLLLFFFGWRVPADQQDFDSEVWHSADYRTGVRQSMLVDLRTNYLYSHMTKEEVIMLLGSGQPYSLSHGNKLTYLLGRARTLMPTVNDEWLYIYFDDADRLTDVDLQEH